MRRSSGEKKLLQSGDWYKLGMNLGDCWPGSRRRERFGCFFTKTSFRSPDIHMWPFDSFCARPGRPGFACVCAVIQRAELSPGLPGRRFMGREFMAGQRESVEELFEAALALNPSGRVAFLDEACNGDPELRRMVEDLLADDERAGSFLRHPPFEFLDNATGSPGPDSKETHSVDGNEPPPAAPPTGRLKRGQMLIDRFLVVRFIAKGGMGEVYEAEDRFLQGVHVALKTILPHIAADPDLQQRFEREVLLARQVVHPNLCPIYDIFHCEDPPPSFLFLTMKLLPGETLAARLQGLVPISVEEGLAILKQMAAGLVAIHEAGIVHRDIKPNNIVLDGIGGEVRVCITDFGLARAHEAETTLFSKGMVAGTPGYIAPELLLGHPPSQASDLFAFGVVLHEIFTGHKPSRTSDNSSMMASPRLSASGAPSFCVQLVRDCLSSDPNRRCQAFEHALGVLNLKRHTTGFWTRRRFAGAAAAAVCTVAAGTWWKWDALENLLHPLPAKRFVALLNWPRTSDSHVAPMLTGVLNAIKSEFARVEAYDRYLFVISPEDVNGDLAAAGHLREVCDPLGANLVLAASGLPDSSHFHLFLRLLDPISGRPLRERKLSCVLDEITSLPARAVKAAASLLDLSRYLRSNKQIEPGTQSVAAFTAFQSAETLMKQPNDTGLNEAIEKYKQAVDLDPGYAIAHAKLALAYGRLYGIRRDPGALDLARGNCEHALALDAGLVDARLSRAFLLEQTGNVQGALDETKKTLALDPSNPRTLLWQARIYIRLNRWADAERTFHRLLQERPNDWVTYNDLGAALHQQGKYQEAIGAFRAASIAAPGSSMALSNLGVEYLQVGDFAKATESLKKSLALQPDSDQAAVNTSIALRYQGRYEEALPFALKAVELSPADDTNWLELGECYTSLRNHQSEAKSAYLRAAKEAEQHLRTNAADGPTWMLLALYHVKSGNPQNAVSLIEKAESRGANDMDSQLYKARILELLGKREEALATLAVCFGRGASAYQVGSFPDLQSLRKDPRYREILQAKSTIAATS
jgi:eukaryotic-like serine/threonine-protein kinase